MSFLNPTFLWASLAVLIPIIVHLFNFRRPQRVLFSDISFVKEVRKTVVRRIRLKQWLLLAARILAILALVFLFAQPVWRSGNTPVAAGKSAIAIVIDNSYSMKAGNESGAYWLQAIKLAREIVSAHGKGDEYLVMHSGDLKLGYAFTGQQEALDNLRDVPLSPTAFSLNSLLSLQGQVFSQAQSPNRILYFLSDFQEATVLQDTLNAGSPPANTFVRLVPLRTRTLRNAFITEHAIASQLLEKDKPLNIKLKMVNESEEALRQAGLRIRTGEEERPVATEDLNAGEVKEIEVSITPHTPGWQSGYIQLDDQPVDFDNQRFFSFYVPERERMLVLEERSYPKLRLMLGSDVLSQFEVSFSSVKNLASLNLDDYKSVVLAGLNEVPTGLAEKLEAHIQQGKSLLILPGETAVLPSWNAFLTRIQAGSWAEKVESEKGLQANQADLAHPLFEGVFQKDARNRSFDGPFVFRYYPFRSQPGVVQSPILRLANGETVLNETRRDGALIYTFAFSMDDAWSDFGIRSTGLTLMVQMARMMNQSQRVQQNEVLGSGAVKRIKTREKDLVKLIGADKKEWIPEQTAENGFVVLRFERLGLKEGNYDVVQNGRLLEKISFNVPDAESRLAAPDAAALRTWTGEKGLTGVEVFEPRPGTFESAIRYQEAGIPLWKWFLSAALLFLVAEFLIQRMKDQS